MFYFKTIYVYLLLLLPLSAQAGLDSYSFFHVTIETPWAIFIFLCFLVLAPFVVMAILYWYFALQRYKQKNKTVAESESE
ncbi:MAG: hypothetical protein COB61_003620 [Thiotrichales bacterium]|nr:hypothetical protein [Thiotrichales bacterium]